MNTIVIEMLSRDGECATIYAELGPTILPTYMQRIEVTGIRGRELVFTNTVELDQISCEQGILQIANQIIARTSLILMANLGMFPRDIVNTLVYLKQNDKGLLFSCCKCRKYATRTEASYRAFNTDKCECGEALILESQ